jgi:hypothetical protein
MKLPLILEKNSSRVFDSDNQFIMKFENYPQDVMEHFVSCVNNGIKFIYMPINYIEGYIETPSNKIALMMPATLNGLYNGNLRKERAEIIINRITIQ